MCKMYALLRYSALLCSIWTCRLLRPFWMALAMKSLALEADAVNLAY